MKNTANRVDLDETASHEPAHLDLHRLPKSLKRDVALNGLSIFKQVVKGPLDCDMTILIIKIDESFSVHVSCTQYS